MYASLQQLHHLPWSQYGHYGQGTLFLQYHIYNTDLAPVRLKHSKCNGWFISRFKTKTLSTQINYTYVYIYTYIYVYIYNIYIYIYPNVVRIYGSWTQTSYRGDNREDTRLWLDDHAHLSFVRFQLYTSCFTVCLSLYMYR